MADYIIKEAAGKKYVEGTFVLENEQDALDITAVCGENETSLLLLNQKNLSLDFYNLRTGLAGAILQKFTMYRIKAAAVLPPEYLTGRFREMVIESNRGNHFRVFEIENDAIKWLIK
jgi:PadR family transcriptional regulator AphA